MVLIRHRLILEISRAKDRKISAGKRCQNEYGRTKEEAILTLIALFAIAVNDIEKHFQRHLMVSLRVVSAVPT